MPQDPDAGLIRLDLSLYAVEDRDKDDVKRLLKHLNSSVAGFADAQLSAPTEREVPGFKGSATSYVLKVASIVLKPVIGAFVDYITKPGQPNVIVEFELPPSKLKLTFNGRDTSAQELVDAIVALHAGISTSPLITKPKSK